MLSVLAVVLVAALSVYDTDAANATVSWQDVKQCALGGAGTCHEVCKDRVEVKIRDRIRDCQVALTDQLLASFERCFNKRRLEVKNDTACWKRAASSNPDEARSKRQTAEENALDERIKSILGELDDYNFCFVHCWRQNQEKLFAGCSKDCQPMANQTKMDIVDNCMYDVFQSSALDLVQEYSVPCGLRAFKLRRQSESLPLRFVNL